MSSIIQREINNAIYLIECTSYRDKNGKPRNKQKCLGRLDADGAVISSRRKLPSQITKVKQTTTKFILKNISENQHN